MTGDGTTSVHGPDGDRHREGPVTPPIVRSTIYRFDSLDALLAHAGGRGGFYTRHGHPNFEVVEAKHAALHGAEASVLFASGMAAVAAVLQTFCRAGSKVVALADCYGGTRALLDRMHERGWIHVHYVPLADVASLADHVEGARLFLGESPTNPLLHEMDLEAAATVVHAKGARFVLDTTFAGPRSEPKPLARGVDLAVDSATKSLGGHSDLMGGLVAGSAELVDQLKETRKLFGAVPDPETAWLLDRGMKTYPVRATQQEATARALAARLVEDPRTAWVRQAGSMIAFTLGGDGEAAIRFLEALQLIANAPSLGGVESLATLPRFTSHALVTAEDRASVGVTDDLVRLSVGLEDEADLWADLDAALGAV